MAELNQNLPPEIDEVGVRKDYLEYNLLQEDSSELNHTYQYEQELLEYVRTGNVEKVIENNENQVFPDYPNLLRGNALKNEEYMAVITVSLVARAAIEGGVTSVDSFRLSDLYLQRIAKARDVKKILAIREEAIVAFTTLVQELQPSGKAGRYVEDAKRYVLANIFKKISVRDVAAALHLNAVYLARVFREAEGRTIGDYIRAEKIERAKNLLIYSDRSIMDISNYLGFSSQSHFGNQFHKLTGLTPKQFRETNQIRKF